MFTFLTFLLLLFLLLLLLFLLFIYTAHKDFTERRDKPHFAPKIFSKNGEIPLKNRQISSPSAQDSVFLSLVFPAYNEEKRLPPTIEKTVAYFETQNFRYEIIIVNDGSRDKTLDTIKEIILKYQNIEIRGVTYDKNAGKGYAVKTGMSFARGEYILMLDSDGATEISDFKILMDKVLGRRMTVAIGSRSLITENVERVWWRKILGNVNNFIVKTLIGIKDIKDTQCGFKLFSRDASCLLFQNLHLVRWAFDVEMIYIAQHSGISVIEVPVNWREIGGSKLVFIPATISFFRDYFAIIVFYLVRLWRIRKID